LISTRRYAACVALLAFAGGCYAPYDLGFQGPFPMSGYHTVYGEEELPLTIFYPDTDPPMEGLPVVIFSPGFIQPRASYESYGKQLAQWGFVAVLRAYPNLGFAGYGDALVDDHVAQTCALIDWLAEENKRPDSRLYGKVDAANVGLTGHSMGAVESIAAAVEDERVRAVVSLDVSHDRGDLTVADRIADCPARFMFIAADSGGVFSVAPTATVPLIQHSAPPTVMTIIHGADHLDFIDTFVGIFWLAHGIYLVAPDGPTEGQEVRDIAMKYMAAWFNVHLKGLEEFEEYYNGPLALKDEREGKVSFIRRLDPGD
jgi:dienelactone hydrolase